jgi:hypothetical protein
MGEQKLLQEHVHDPLLAVKLRTQNHQKWTQRLKRLEFVGGHVLLIYCDALLF